MYSYEAFLQYKTVTYKIESILEKESTYQLLSSHEAMIDEEIKWEFVKQIQFFLGIASYVPLTCMFIEQIMIIFVCKEKNEIGSIISAWFVMSNFIVFLMIYYFIYYTYTAKYEEYRYHFEEAMRDLEQVALLQAALLIASLLHMLLYDRALLNVVNAVEETCAGAAAILDKWIIEEEGLESDSPKQAGQKCQA